ncbi:hypothetical protein H6F95_01860 [Cyanobacteria bacterium FACHB-471]|nr:hypothetical protein [Cyanobacteria bacterium FACHB-471]
MPSLTYKMWRSGEDGLLKQLLSSKFKEPHNMPQQHLPTLYGQTGHTNVDSLQNHHEGAIAR